MLAIEIDGETHNYKISADRVRQNRLEALGIKVLRFLDIDIKRQKLYLAKLTGKSRKNLLKNMNHCNRN